MADYTKQDIFDIITEYLETYGSAIGSGAVHELTPEELTDENLRVLTIPGMRPDNQQWVQTSMKNMILPITNAVSDITTLKQQTIQVRDEASAAAINANNMATEASRVNATLVGMTVTVVDRNGQSSSVNIGFEIYDTYGSVAEMNADAANVPVGKFVMIATSDPTDPENARLYGRNSNPATSDNPFTFLSDLDQASSSAWADWLNNKKPQIEQAISDANASASLANQKAELAQTATTATNNARIAIEQNEATRQQNEQGRVSAENQRAMAWNEFFSDTLATGCRKLWKDFWTNINSLWTGFWGESASDPNGVRKQWTDLKADAQSDHTRAGQDHNVATTDHATATTDHSVATQDHNVAVSDHSTATTDHTRAIGDHNTATEDHNQYVQDASVAGQDHTRAVQDHDTASEDHTIADADHTIAVQDHTVAEADHTTANADHTTAQSDHVRAETDHTDSVNATRAANTATNYANEEGDYAKNIGDHPMYIGDGTNGDLNYLYVWYYATQQYIRGPYIKGDDLHWEEMSEQEKQDLASRVLEQLVFATPEETRAMLNELT